MGVPFPSEEPKIFTCGGCDSPRASPNSAAGIRVWYGVFKALATCSQHHASAVATDQVRLEFSVSFPCLFHRRNSAAGIRGWPFPSEELRSRDPGVAFSIGGTPQQEKRGWMVAYHGEKKG